MTTAAPVLGTAAKRSEDSQRTWVAAPTSTGPGGTTSTTLTRVVDVAYISRFRTVLRTWAALGGATCGRSCTSTETASPAVTTLPCRVSRSSGASRLTTTDRGADSTTVVAGRTAAARTWTAVPSATPRLASSSSSQSSRSGGVPGGARAASAPVRRAPSSRTTSSGPRPSAASTWAATRTSPRDCSSTGSRRTAVRVRTAAGGGSGSSPAERRAATRSGVSTTARPRRQVL